MFGKLRSKKLEQIKEEIRHSGTLSILMMESVDKAFFGHKIELCDQVVTQVTEVMEKEMDEKENLIERHCIRYLALYAPKAKTLRTMIMFLEINQNLERIGDLCCGIAKSIQKYNAKKYLTKELKYFRDLFAKTLSILINTNKSIHNEDVFSAIEVLKMDQDIDDTCEQVIEKILQQFKKNPKKSDQIYELLKIVPRLERIGDHCKNIAEEVVYLAEGEVLRH